MSLVLVALTLFALLLILAQRQRPLAVALWIVGLAVSEYALPGPAKVAAPLIVVLTLAVGESLAGFRTR
jgi:hypothetical protein